MEAVDKAFHALKMVVEYYDKVSSLRKLGKKETEIYEATKEALRTLKRETKQS